jgi:hypothetical protein
MEADLDRQDQNAQENPSNGTKFKGILSRDFEVCFLVPLDSSDIATPAGTGSFKKNQFHVEFLIFRALALVVFTVSESRLRERPGFIS